MDMQDKTQTGINAGDVRIFYHTGNAPEELRAAAEYWRNTLTAFGFANSADFDIHVWDLEDFSHIEVGARVYNKKGYDGIVSRALMVMDLIKGSRKGCVLLCHPSNPWHADIKGFTEDTEAFLKRDYGWKDFMTMDMEEFEFKFFRFEPMMLSEDGRRIARDGSVLLEDGYRTFGLTTKAMVDMML